MLHIPTCLPKAGSPMGKNRKDSAGGRDSGKIQKDGGRPGAGFPEGWNRKDDRGAGFRRDGIGKTAGGRVSGEME